MHFISTMMLSVSDRKAYAVKSVFSRTYFSMFVMVQIDCLNQQIVVQIWACKSLKTEMHKMRPFVAHWLDYSGLVYIKVSGGGGS